MAKRSGRARDRDAARRNTRMRFEQWARNPGCEANTISAVRNVRMAKVAEALNVDASFGQSPFAIVRGDQFERSLFYREAERLRQELIRKDVLPEDASGFLDLRIRLNGGTRLASLDQAIDETRDLFQCIASARTKRQRKALPTIVAGATVRIPKGVLLPDAVLIIDALAIRMETPPKLIVGEIKTYPDRGGHTDPHELALARAQAGIYVHALDLVVAELNVSDRIHVSRDGFLVLTRPGSNAPSVRAGEDLRYQAERARRGFELLERAATTLDPDLWAEDSAEPQDVLVEAVADAQKDYNDGCMSFCDLASKCYCEACAAGDPVILGEDVRRFLGTINLHRMLDLLKGGRPKNDAERDFVRRIEESDWLMGK